MVDEGARSGGQIYRRPPEGFKRPAAALYGFEARKAEAVHAALDGLRERIDYRPGTLIWNIEGRVALALGPAGVERIAFDALILATGAMDRVIPFPGWTLPGVFTMGGSQVALKAQGCAIGDPVVFMGTGPLLYLVAYQYVHAGAHVAAVLDTSHLSQAIPVFPGLLWGARTLAKGLWYMTWLRAAGVPVRAGPRPSRRRRRRLEAVTLSRTGAAASTGSPATARTRRLTASGRGTAELRAGRWRSTRSAPHGCRRRDEDGPAPRSSIYLGRRGRTCRRRCGGGAADGLAALALLADKGSAGGPPAAKRGRARSSASTLRFAQRSGAGAASPPSSGADASDEP